MGAEQIQVYSDSQLVVNQVLQQYEARKESMIAYLSLVREITTNLKGLSITQIPRETNTEADWLARLASSSKTDLPSTRVEFLFKPSVPCPNRRPNRDRAKLDGPHLGISDHWEPPGREG